MVTSVFIVFQHHVFALFYLCATLSFLTQYMAMWFNVLPNVSLEPFYVFTSGGDSNVANWVNRKVHVSLSH